MDIRTAIAEIASLSIDDRLDIVEAIWAGIVAEPGEPAVTSAQLQELRRRLEAHLVAPNNVVEWEQVKSEALARTRQ